MIRIVEDDLTAADTIALLDYHLRDMHCNSLPGSVFAFDIERLRAADVTFWAAREGDVLLGCGAVKQVDADTGEIKSMRTDPAHLRKGVAAALLDFIIAVGRRRGYKHLSLETGSGPAFDPALALYRRRGFVNGDAFGDYEPTDFNQFLYLPLT